MTVVVERIVPVLPRTPEEKQMLSIHQASELTGLSRRVFNSAILDGRLEEGVDFIMKRGPGINKRGMYLIRQDAVERIAASITPRVRGLPNVCKYRLCNVRLKNGRSYCCREHMVADRTERGSYREMREKRVNYPSSSPQKGTETEEV